MNETLTRAGIVLVLVGVVILLTVAALWLEQREQARQRQAQLAARLTRISVRDGYRYRPARRHHGAAAIGLLAYLNKTRRGS